LDVPQRSMVRALSEFRALLGCQFPLKPMEQEVNYFFLSVADHD